MPRDTLELFTPFFASLTDPRIDRTKRHNLLDMVILAVCATLGNADGWADIERYCKAKIDFFRTFLKLANGIPSHDTFGRVFGLLDPARLMACIQEWLNALATVVGAANLTFDANGNLTARAIASKPHPIIRGPVDFVKGSANDASGV